MQQWASCPFCTKTFEVQAGKSVQITVDRIKRWAHIECVPANKEQRKEAAE